MTCVVDDRHPQEQGLKRDDQLCDVANGRIVDDRHPQEQGLKPYDQLLNRS